MAKHALFAHVRPGGDFKIYSDITTQQLADNYITWYFGTVEKASAAGHRMIQCEVELPDSAGDKHD